MDDLIPFLIVILIAIIGSISRIKKKRMMDENSTQSRPIKNDDLFSWLEKLTDEEDKQPFPYREEENYMPKEEPVEIIEEKKEETPEPTFEKIENKYAQYNGFISPEEKQQLVKNEGFSFAKKAADKDDLTKSSVLKSVAPNLNRKKGFDLRKAVIYSEILNRKYN